jgi:hypothetical protein
LFLPLGLVIIFLSSISLIAELLPEVQAKPIVMTTLILTIIVVILAITGKGLVTK